MEKIIYMCLEDYEDPDGYFIDGQLYENWGIEGDKLKMKNENGVIVLMPDYMFELVEHE